jgi:hypothetical protein
VTKLKTTTIKCLPMVMNKHERNRRRGRSTAMKQIAMTDGVLPAIPVIDVRYGGTPDIARVAEDQLRDLFGRARRAFTPPLLGLADRVSQNWLQRSANPYLSDIDEISAMLRGKGAYALNTSYEWACTSGVGDDPEGGVHLLRVLDWKLSGLGRNLVVATQTGPAGDFVNVTWPGFVGVLTAMAPGRFAAAINQPPMTSFGMTPPVDWMIGHVRLWHSDGLPPAHLLRQVFEVCKTYEAAKQMLAQTPLCLPAFFTLAGANDGEGCIIERTQHRAAIREMPTAIANHWIALPKRGRARTRTSRHRHRMMQAAVEARAPWQAHPILNQNTRVVATMNPSRGELSVQGFERSGPATSCLVVGGQGTHVG